MSRKKNDESEKPQDLEGAAAAADAPSPASGEMAVPPEATLTPPAGAPVVSNGEVEALGFDPSSENPETETITNAAPGTYIIDVYDCANGCDTLQGTPGDYTITVTVTSP